MKAVRPRQLATAALALVVAGPFACAAPTCDHPDVQPFFSQNVSVTGVSSVGVRAVTPRAAEILVTALPSAVDVQLESLRASGAASHAVDSPVMRFGPRWIIVPVGADGVVEVRVQGKERQGHGTVRVLMTTLVAGGDAACIEMYRALAAAGAHYAAGAGPAGGSGPLPGTDAPAEYQAAAVGYDAAAAAPERGADRLIAQAVLAAAAVRYQDLSQWRAAADAAARAAAAFGRLGDSYTEARAKFLLASADMELALADRARQADVRAAQLRLENVRQRFVGLARFHADRRQFFDEAQALNMAGLTDYYAGQFARGMASYQKALPVYRQLHEYPYESQVLQNIALMEYELGRFPESKRDYRHALELVQAESSSSLPGEILNNLALVEYASGDLDRALEHYAEALQILQRLQVPLEVARSLHGLGFVYYTAGDSAQALDYFMRALKMRSPDQDPRGRTSTLRALASVQSDLGHTSEAIALRREALALAVAPSVRVRIEAQLARDLETSGQHTEAITQVAQAVTESAAAPTVYRGLAFATRAELELDASNPTAARGDVRRALALLENGEADSQQFNAWVLAARIARAQGELQQANVYLDRALRLAEHMRLESANPELRAGVWQRLKPAFDLKIDLTAPEATVAATTSTAHGDTARETLATAEGYRARSLADYWHERLLPGGSQDSGGARERALYQAIADRRFELEVRVERSGEDDSRSRSLRADIAALRQEADTLHRTVAATDPDTPAALRAVLNRVAAMIPPDAAVIEYWLGSTRARAWVITRQGVRMVSLGASAPIDRSARALHQALRGFATVPVAERTRLIRELSRQVIGPVATEVMQHRLLVVVPDGALHYLPFSVLQAPGEESQPLVNGHVITVAPSLAAALWQAPATAAPAMRVLVVDDPVYSSSDPRLQRPDLRHEPESPKRVAQGLTLNTRFERLPATAIEAARVEDIFPPQLVDKLDGFSASRQALLGLDLSHYRVIHIAAHAVTDTQAPLLSALVLSLRDSEGAGIPGEVFAGEIALQHLNADLVVLSACDTALGREITGEGLLGLRYAVHAAGGRAVIASLWPATDRVTTELMSSFYAHTVHEGEPAAEALTYAMRESLTRFTDPALWGAFEISVTGAGEMFDTHRNQH